MREFENAFGPPSAWANDALFYKQLIKQKEKHIRCIVELGVHFGYSLFTMAKDFPDAIVMGVDNFSYHDSEDARAHVMKFSPEFPNVRILEGDTVTTAKSWHHPELYLDIDVLHIDAGHNLADVAADFEAWAPYVMPGGVVLFHDINTTDGVRQFFDELDGEKAELGNLGAWYKPND